MNDQHTTNENVSVEAQKGVHVTASYVIDLPRPEIFTFWRKLENLPIFMKHLESVKQITPTLSHWVAKGALGVQVEWDAQIINEKENELIAWRSVNDASLANAGSVRFKDAENGTLVEIDIEYVPPLGKLSDALAGLFSQNLQRLLEKDLHEFKKLVDADDDPTVESPQFEKRRGWNK